MHIEGYTQRYALTQELNNIQSSGISLLHSAVIKGRCSFVAPNKDFSFLDGELRPEAIQSELCFHL